MVIAITAIVGSMVAVFLRAPTDSYIAQDRRARLTDTADTALRRMGRDIRLALPNSVRVASVAGVVYLEFLETRDGGRYRAEGDGTPGNDNLDFTIADASFEVLGPAIDMRAGDLIAVYNLGIEAADAWNGDTLRPYAGTPGFRTTIALTPSTPFPLASPGHRFQVVEGPVTYACNPAARTVTRYWGYPVTAAQATPPAAPATSALIATGVAACNFIYEPGATERGGLVSLSLDLSRDGETVRLYSATQVSNQP